MRRIRKQRKTYIVDKPFQIGFIKKISVLALLLVTSSLIFFALSYHLYGEGAVPGINPLYDSSKATMDSLLQYRTAFDILWPVMAICLCLILLITFIYGVILSHRMAGPLYRLQQELAQLAAGVPGRNVVLRQGDEFESLCKEVNNVKQQYRTMLDGIQQAIVALNTDDSITAINGLTSLQTAKEK